MSVLALWVVLRSVDLAKCADVIAHANPLPIAACLLVIAAQVTLRSIRWRLLVWDYRGLFDSAVPADRRRAGRGRSG